MKRTYVDIIGEYYDSQDDILNQANQLGLREADLRKVFRTKKGKQRRRFIEG